jgi:hypothetical protein
MHTYMRGLYICPTDNKDEVQLVENRLCTVLQNITALVSFIAYVSITSSFLMEHLRAPSTINVNTNATEMQQSDSEAITNKLLLDVILI